MSDSSEIAALKASFRGAVRSAEALAALAPRIEALDPHAGLPAEELDELSRITAAHAVASAALRGLVNTMRARRGVEAG
jgi:predicted RecB family endonuclease